MTKQAFRFKEFTINQDRCAMKVGTDGVLLGAWTHISSNVDSILDIGAGTGLLALQCAQRSYAETIDALEIDDQAYEQAVENFENSPWSDRLFCYHASFQEFVDEMDESYDLIISNPPYFTDTFKSLEEKRALARHTIELPFKELLEGCSKLLSEGGQCSFVLPFKESGPFLELAEEVALYPMRITHVRGTENSPIKRTLLQLGRHQQSPSIDELVLELERHVPTEDYRSLTKDFYLNF